MSENPNCKVNDITKKVSFAWKSLSKEEQDEWKLGALCQVTA